MSRVRLSGALKALVNKPHARSNPPSLSHIPSVYEGIARDAGLRHLGIRSWVTIAAAVTFTLNSPASLIELYKVAVAGSGGDEPYVAELIREVGLKCISFNGIPRTINGLNAFREALPEHVAQRLHREDSRVRFCSSAERTSQRGAWLWRSIYAPFHDKRSAKLSAAHPDLPGYIIGSHYGALLVDPSSKYRGSLVTTGRLLTSLIAVSCLRAQPDVVPQLMSHVRGLQRAGDLLQPDEATTGESSHDEADENTRATQRSRTKEVHPEDLQTVGYLTSEEGITWTLNTVDNLVAAFEGLEKS